MQPTNIDIVVFNTIFYIQWVCTVFAIDQHFISNGSVNSVLLMTAQLMVLMVTIVNT